PGCWNVSSGVERTRGCELAENRCGRRQPVMPFITSGAAFVGGAAMLLAGPGGVSALEAAGSAPRTEGYEASLLACASTLPLMCEAGDSVGGLGGASHDRSAFSASALGMASFGPDWNPGGAFLGLIGPGGLLIGDGLNGTDAYIDENGVFHEATRGGNG